MSQLFDVKDQTFVISGGASGLGSAYAQVLLSKGAKGIAILDIAEEIGKATAEHLNNLYNEKTLFVKCDVSSEEDITAAFDSVLAQFKQIDVIINNAGIMNDASNQWRTACDVNLKGLIALTLKGIEHMRKDEGGAGGTIVNISSTAGLKQFVYLPIYSACKLAVMHFSQNLAMDSFFERTAVRVLTICPGATETPLLLNLEARSYETRLGKRFADMIDSRSITCQTVDSAVAAFVHIIENGAPGSIWVSVDNKPAKDITTVINRLFKMLADEIHA